MASRLAELYQLPLYNAKQLLASADKLGPDDAKVRRLTHTPQW